MSSILVRKLHNMLSDTSKTTQFFFSIDMRDSRFTVIACVQVKLLRVFCFFMYYFKLFVFLCVFCFYVFIFMCYRSFSVEVYTLATMIGNRVQVFSKSAYKNLILLYKVFFQHSKYFLGNTKKPLRRCTAHNPVQKKKIRRVNGIIALIALFVKTHRKKNVGVCSC